MVDRVVAPQARIHIGTATYDGRVVPVTISQEWMLFLERLTSQSNSFLASALVGAQGVAGASVMLDDGGGADVEFVPGPKGERGERGEPGPAIFLLEDPVETEIFWKVS